MSDQQNLSLYIPGPFNYPEIGSPAQTGCPIYKALRAPLFLQFKLPRQDLRHNHNLFSQLNKQAPVYGDPTGSSPTEPSSNKFKSAYSSDSNDSALAAKGASMRLPPPLPLLSLDQVKRSALQHSRTEPRKLHFLRISYLAIRAGQDSNSKGLRQPTA